MFATFAWLSRAEHLLYADVFSLALRKITIAGAQSWVHDWCVIRIINSIIRDWVSAREALPHVSWRFNSGEGNGAGDAQPCWRSFMFCFYGAAPRDFGTMMFSCKT